MDRIKFMTTDETKTFEIPWEWIEKDGIKPKTNDLESKAKRGAVNGTLFRKRLAKIPDHILNFNKTLRRGDILPLLKIIDEEKFKVYYFDHWTDEYVTTFFYSPKPDLTVRELPEDDNTDNILYAPFSIEFISYEDVS